jgi:hypothetical protein
VLLWINGAFGGGKTQTAHEVHRRLPGSVVCDPEQIGFGLHRAMPRHLRGDFQDLRAWRAGVVEVLDLVLRGHDGPVIVPMTLVHEQYVDEVLGGLRARGHEVRHVALLARPETVARRLRERGVGRLGRTLLTGERQESFALARLDTCLDRLQQPELAVQVWNDDLSVSQTADAVAAAAGLRLVADTSTRLGAWTRRTVTSLRHVRL